MADLTTPSKKLQTVFRAFLHWLGEAVVGLVPLLAFLIMHFFSAPRVKTFVCDIGAPPDPKSCSELLESPSQEVCILTVVVSGLAIWSLLSGPSTKITALTKLQVIISVLSLLSGSLLYALYGAQIARQADNFAYGILVIALISSFFLAIERAVAEE